MATTLEYAGVRSVDIKNVDATEYGYGTKMIMATINQTRQLSLSSVSRAH